jgi:hypothetical protein
LYLCDTGILFVKACLEDNGDSRPVEKMASSPVEVDFDAVTNVHQLDQPEGLRFEVSHSIISVDDESKGRELARSVTDYRLTQIFTERLKL